MHRSLHGHAHRQLYRHVRRHVLWVLRLRLSLLSCHTALQHRRRSCRAWGSTSCLSYANSAFFLTGCQRWQYTITDCQRQRWRIARCSAPFKRNTAVLQAGKRHAHQCETSEGNRSIVAECQKAINALLHDLVITALEVLHERGNRVGVWYTCVQACAWTRAKMCA